MENLSLNKKITSDVSHYSDYSAEKAVDGDLSSAFLVSPNNTVANLTIDLENLCVINHLELTNFSYSGVYRTKDFDIYGSKDGQNYSLILSGTLPNNSNQHIFENPNKENRYRYIRLTIKTHYGSNHSVGIGEIKINGYFGFTLLKSNNKIYSLKSEEILHETKMTSNTAPSGEAFSSSDYNAGRQAWLAFNGTNTSSTDNWSSTYADGNSGNAFIGYDFKKPVIINRISIVSRNDATYYYTSIKTFDFEGWDGSQWIKIGSYDLGDWTTANQRKSLTMDSKTAYTKYRLNKAKAQSGSFGVTVAMLEMYSFELTHIPNHSVENFIDYGMSSLDNFNSILNHKNYILQDNVSENTDGLWVQDIDRKPLSIKFE